MKTFRFLCVLIAGGFVTYGVPFLTGFSYVFYGHDYSVVVLFLVSTLGEAARRYTADHSLNTANQ